MHGRKLYDLCREHHESSIHGCTAPESYLGPISSRYRGRFALFRSKLSSRNLTTVPGRGISSNIVTTLDRARGGRMASTARTLRELLHRVSLSHGFSSSLSSLKNPSTLQSFGLFEKKATVGDVLRLRRIWTSPVCMGRRSCKIAGRKDAQNLKKMKRNGKIGKEIVAA